LGNFRAVNASRVDRSGYSVDDALTSVTVSAAKQEDDYKQDKKQDRCSERGDEDWQYPTWRKDCWVAWTPNRTEMRSTRSGHWSTEIEDHGQTQEDEDGRPGELPDHSPTVIPGGAESKG
jgi:hypothetical protein